MLIKLAPFALLLAISIAVVLTCRAFPSQDGPIHLYYAEVTRNLLLHTGHYQTGFVIARLLSPYVFEMWILMSLMGAVDAVVAEKLLVCLYLAGFCFGFRYLLKALAPSDETLPLFSFLFVFNYPIYMGFYNFCLGMAISFWIAGFWVRYCAALTWKRSAIFAALITLVALTHPLALSLSLLFLGLHVAVLIGARIWAGSGKPVSTRVLEAIAMYRRPVLHIAAAATAVLWSLRFASGNTNWQVSSGDIMMRLHSYLLMWAVAPVQARVYRWALLAALLLAVAATLLRFWRERSLFPSTASISIPLMGAICLSFSILAPKTLGGPTNAVFNRRSRLDASVPPGSPASSWRHHRDCLGLLHLFGASQPASPGGDPSISRYSRCGSRVERRMGDRG